jgi:hypothetical protein
MRDRPAGPDDVDDAPEAAWDAVHEALPARWHVSPVVCDLGRHAWGCAHGPLPGRSRAPETVTGTDMEEAAALRDLAGRLSGARPG